MSTLDATGLLFLSLASSVGLETVRVFFWQKRWNERDIHVSSVPWLPFLRIVIAFAAGVSFGFVMNSFPAAVASTSIAWLAVLTVETDFINYKIPREACWTVFVIGTLAGFLAWDIYSAIYAFIAFIVLGGVTTLVALITKGGLGSGDVRFLIAVSPLAWWIGVVPLLMGIILGCVIQAGIKLAIMMRKGNARELPFGPALAIGISIWVIAAISLSDGCINHAGVLGCG